MFAYPKNLGYFTCRIDRLSMLKYYLTTCLLALLGHSSSAQDSLSHHHRLALRLGPGKLISQDEAISPLRYRGTAVMYHLGYQFEGDKNQHTVSLDFSPPTLNTDIELVNRSDNPLNAIYFKLAYHYWRIVPLAREAFRFRWGGQWSGSILDKYHLLANEVYAGDFFVGLSPSAALDYLPNQQHILSWEVAYVAVAWTTGEPYGFAFGDLSASSQVRGDDFVKQGQWLTINRLTDIQSTITYEYHFHPRWSWQTVYQFRYLHYQRTLPTKNALHSLQFGLSFGL